MPVNGALSPAVCSAANQEHQGWILKRFLTQVEGQEAADEEEPHSIAGEFAVSQVFVAFRFGLRFQILRDKFIVTSKLLGLKIN